MFRSDPCIGTSGYSYAHWGNGVFYPTDVKSGKWLEYYAKYFNSVELNVSFYRLPKKEIFEGWRRRTPKNFRFVAKGSRFITHIKKLKDVEEPLEVFFENVLGLEEKVSAVLWQLPPGMKVDIKKLEKFCEFLKKWSPQPRPTNEPGKIRQVFEFRNQSWFCEEVYEILREHNFSLCIAHSGRWPVVEKVTADFVYLRFHGGGDVLYSSNYTEQELRDWATKAKNWLKQGKAVYAYFNNDTYGYAVKNALRLKELLNVDV